MAPSLRRTIFGWTGPPVGCTSARTTAQYRGLGARRLPAMALRRRAPRGVSAAHAQPCESTRCTSTPPLGSATVSPRAPARGRPDRPGGRRRELTREVHTRVMRIAPALVALLIAAVVVGCEAEPTPPAPTPTVEAILTAVPTPIATALATTEPTPTATSTPTATPPTTPTPTSEAASTSLGSTTLHYDTYDDSGAVADAWQLRLPLRPRRHGDRRHYLRGPPRRHDDGPAHSHVGRRREPRRPRSTTRSKRATCSSGARPTTAGSATG